MRDHLANIPLKTMHLCRPLESPQYIDSIWRLSKAERATSVTMKGGETLSPDIPIKHHKGLLSSVDISVGVAVLHHILQALDVS